MTDEQQNQDTSAEDETAGREGPDSEAMRALLRRALPHPERDSKAPDVLRGVQRKIRRRSRGKFFADGWSTGTLRSRMPIAIVATTMLVILVATYFLLGPVGISAP